mmetsp:Transcript_33960/g.33116  ORF Transcript_33960/g.33116 Transcript_33960/m.33116 type:complete len:87 (+) Transcript_33960:88-348(+)
MELVAAGELEGAIEGLAVQWLIADGAGGIILDFFLERGLQALGEIQGLFPYVVELVDLVLQGRRDWLSLDHMAVYPFAKVICPGEK